MKDNPKLSSASRYFIFSPVLFVYIPWTLGIWEVCCVTSSHSWTAYVVHCPSWRNCIWKKIFKWVLSNMHKYQEVSKQNLALSCNDQHYSLRVSVVLCCSMLVCAYHSMVFFSSFVLFLWPYCMNVICKVLKCCIYAINIIHQLICLYTEEITFLMR